MDKPDRGQWAPGGVPPELADLRQRTDALANRLDRLELAVGEVALRLDALQARLGAEAAPVARSVDAGTAFWAPSAPTLPEPPTSMPAPEPPAEPSAAVAAPPSSVTEGEKSFGEEAIESPEEVPEEEAATPPALPQVQPERPAAAWPEPPPPRVVPTPTRPRRSWSAADIERAVSGRGLAWVGGLALVLGAIFFLSLAFSRGWIGPGPRVVIGLVAGLALTLGGGWVLQARDALVGRVLVAVGIGVWNLALFAGARLYGLVAPEAAMLGVLVASTVATLIAIRADAQELALFSMAAALAAPPIMGAPPTGTTIAFLSIVLLATTVLAFRRRWSWLPPAAFLITVPQITSWLFGRDRDPWLALAVLGGFWLLHALSAAGQADLAERGGRRWAVRVMALLLILDTLFAALFGELLGWQVGPKVPGFCLLALAVALGALAVHDARRHDVTTLFGGTAAVLGALLLAIAVLGIFDGQAVPIVWAACGAAFSVLSNRTQRSLPGLFATGFLAIAGIHLLTVEYPLGQFLQNTSGPPLRNANTLALVAVVAGLAVAGWQAGRGATRIAAYLAAFGLVAAALPHELSGVPLLAGWCVLTVVASLAVSWTPLSASALPMPGVSKSDLRPVLVAPVLVGAVLAIGHLVTVEYPLAALFDPRIPPATLTVAARLGTILVLATLAFVARAAGQGLMRQLAYLAGAGVVAAVLPHELGGLAILAAWSALTVRGGAALRWPVVAGPGPAPIPTAFIPPAGMATLAVGHLLRDDLPVRQFRVALDASRTPFTDHGSAAAAIVALGAIGVAVVSPNARLRSVGVAAAVAVLGYLAPFQLGAAPTVVAMSVLAVVALLLATRMPPPQAPLAVAVALLVVAGVVVFAILAPPSRLVVDPERIASGAPIWAVAVAVAAWVAALGFAARQPIADRFRRGLVALGALAVVWFLSVAVVDLFQRQAQTSPDTVALVRQGQVALSVLWAVLGGVLVAAGLLRFGTTVRLLGLALLGVATVKVFLYDLRSLDATYRVLSFIALGALLLASSYAYRRVAGSPALPAPESPPGKQEWPPAPPA